MNLPKITCRKSGSASQWRVSKCQSRKSMAARRNLKRRFGRNFREYAAGAIAIVLLGFSFASSHDVLSRIAFALLIAGMGYVFYQLHRHGRAKNVPGEMGLGPSLQFYRNELERQRDLAGSVWTWYLGPFVPGLLISMIASMLHDTHLRHVAVVALWYALMAA